MLECSGDGSLRVLLSLEPQPSLVVKNLLLDGEPIEFSVDDDEPFPLPLDCGGGSAEYNWSSTEATAARTDDSPVDRGDGDGPSREESSIFHPSKAPLHLLRLRRGGAWSKRLWLAEGAQVVELRGPVMVRAFDRAGTLVVAVSSFATEEELSQGVEALKRYAHRPGHLDVSLVLPHVTVHVHDDSQPLATTGTGPRGLVFPEVIQLHGSGVVFRMSERPPEPHLAPVGFVFAEESAHVKYLTSLSLVAQDIQVDAVAAGCDFPVALAFQPHPRALPCLLLHLDTVSVHGRPERPHESHAPPAVLLDRPSLAADVVLPYLAGLRVDMPRRALVAAEQALLSALTGLGARFLDAATAPLLPTPPPLPVEPVDGQVLAWVAAALAHKTFLGSASVSSLAAAVTLRCFVSGVFVGLDRTPLLFQPVSLRRICAPAAHLTSELTSNYALDALLRSPQVVGSLQLLGSPTLLIGAVGRGLRDLVALPLEALPLGPVATGRACIRGGASFVRHVSGGALSSVSSFSSSVSRNLTSLQRPRAPPDLAAAHDGSDDDDDDDNQASLDPDQVERAGTRAEEQGSAAGPGRVASVLGSVGKAVLLAPLVGAIGLVGRTTASLSAAVSGAKAQAPQSPCMFSAPALCCPLALTCVLLACLPGDGGSGASGRSPRPLAPPGGTPLVTPQLLDLWTRAKLLPWEPRLALLLRADVRVALAQTPIAAADATAGSTADTTEGATAAVKVGAKAEGKEAQVSMVLLVTHTRLFLERRGAIALQAPLASVTLQPARGTVIICIGAVVALACPDDPQGSQRLVVGGLSTRQLATLAAAVDKRRATVEEYDVPSKGRAE